VLNESPTTASFELTAAYDQMFTTVDLLPGIPTAGIGERRYDIRSIGVVRDEIPAASRKTMIVKYMEDKQGTIPKNYITFNLTATAGPTVYGLDTETTRFGTTLIAEDGGIVSGPAAEELRMRIYPIRSHVEHVGPGPKYNLILEITNTFDSPMEAEMVQPLPSDIAQVRVENGTKGQQDVSWELTLDAMKPWTGVISLSFWAEPLNTVQIPPALLRIYDRINDTWVEFPTEEITL
jgi:hypothetical protein